MGLQPWGQGPGLAGLQAPLAPGPTPTPWCLLVRLETLGGLGIKELHNLGFATSEFTFHPQLGRSWAHCSAWKETPRSPPRRQATRNSTGLVGRLLWLEPQKTQNLLIFFFFPVLTNHLGPVNLEGWVESSNAEMRGLVVRVLRLRNQVFVVAGAILAVLRFPPWGC